MYKDNQFTLTLAGVTYKARKPKVKDWYDMAKFDDSIKDIGIADYIKGAAACVAAVFDDLTADDIIKNMDIDDIKPAYRDCWAWLVHCSNEKLEQLPNGETGTAQQ